MSRLPPQCLRSTKCFEAKCQLLQTLITERWMQKPSVLRTWASEEKSFSYQKPFADFRRFFHRAETMSSPTFPMCGNACGANCRNGSVHAQATWSIPAETAWGNDLVRLRSQTRHFILVAASDGNGRAKCHAHNAGTSFETAQMQRG